MAPIRDGKERSPPVLSKVTVTTPTFSLTVMSNTVMWGTATDSEKQGSSYIGLVKISVIALEKWCDACWKPQNIVAKRRHKNMLLHVE